MTMNDAQVCNLAQLLRQTAALHPDRTGLIQGDRTWSWREIDTRVDAMVAALRSLGVRRGDRILVQSRNTLAMFESCWVAFRLGAVWVPVNFRLTPPEVAYLGAASGASVMLVDDGFDAHVDAVRAASPAMKTVVPMGGGKLGELNWEALVESHRGAEPFEQSVAADDPLWFFYTSGTTGRPKAGVLTHGQMAFVINNHLADLMPAHHRKRRERSSVAPLSHGAGVHSLLTQVARGAASVLTCRARRLDPAEVLARSSNATASPTSSPSPPSSPCSPEHPEVDAIRPLLPPLHHLRRRPHVPRRPATRASKARAKSSSNTSASAKSPATSPSSPLTSTPPKTTPPNANIGSCGYGPEPASTSPFSPPKHLRRLPALETGEICCRGPGRLHRLPRQPRSQRQDASPTAGSTPATSAASMRAACSTSRAASPTCTSRAAPTSTRARSRRCC